MKAIIIIIWKQVLVCCFFYIVIVSKVNSERTNFVSKHDIEGSFNKKIKIRIFQIIVIRTVLKAKTNIFVPIETQEN